MGRKDAEMDLCDSPVVIAIDPGGTTGWAILQVHPESLFDPEVRILDNVDWWKSGQFTGSEDQQAKDICDLFFSWPGAAMVVEDFILRKMSKDRELLSPVRITAKVEHSLWLRKSSYFLQAPSEAKTTATDERLKSWGLHRPGEEHARDATRHAITFMRKAKERTRLRMYAWQHLYAPGGEYATPESKDR